MLSLEEVDELLSVFVITNNLAGANYKLDIFGDSYFLANKTRSIIDFSFIRSAEMVYVSALIIPPDKALHVMCWLDQRDIQYNNSSTDFGFPVCFSFCLDKVSLIREVVNKFVIEMENVYEH